MKKRKLLCSLLALVLAVSMTACNESKSLDSAEETTSQSSVTTTTTTTALQTTTETHSTKVTSVTNERTILGNEIYLSKDSSKLKLHKLEGMDDWIMNKGTKKDG